MLGDYTECDLSSKESKLDISAVEEQLRYHYFALLNEIRTIISCDNWNKEEVNDRISSLVSTGSAFLKYKVMSLAKTAEILHTLNCRYSRKITNVNLRS